MANTYTTLADLIKLNDLNARDNGITDLLNQAPVLAALFATTASNGTKHSYLKQTTAPTVGFRAINTGKAVSASGYTEVTQSLQILDATVVTDQELANSYRYGFEKFQEREGMNALQQALFTAEQQVFYGTTAGAAAGFSGLGDDANYNTASSSLVVNADGTTAGTGNSIWLIRSTPDEKSIAAVLGNTGEIQIGEMYKGTKADDSDPTKFFNTYITPIVTYMGIQIGGKYSAVRIGNITADAGKGATDALIASAIAKFPANSGPTLIAMNRLCRAQLQKSRTATNSTGSPAPFPQESFGVPIIVTDSLLSTETLLA